MAGKHHETEQKILREQAKAQKRARKAAKKENRQ
jgi:hypothetical protein